MFTVLTGNVAQNSNIFEITNSVIDDNSIIEVYPSDESIIPVEVSVTGSTLVVTFDSKATNIIPIKIFVNNLVGEYVPPSTDTIDENVINTNSSIPLTTQKEINANVERYFELLDNRVGSGELDTEADNLTDAVNEINDRIPDGELGTFLYHGVNGNVWIPIDASNLNYDDDSTMYSAMGDIDELTTTSKNLVGAINEIKSSGGGVSYSTTEFDTGKTWIDGKKIYCKVFTGNTLVGGNNLTDVSDLQIDTPVNITMSVKVTLSGNTRWRPVPFTYWLNGSDPSWYGGVFYNYPEDTINAQLGSSLINGVNNWFIIVEYTKRS